jgi:signal transduction histidine kinase
MVAGVITGALSLASVSVVRSWPEPLFPRVRLLGELLASMVARSRASQRLHDALQEAGQYRERLAHLERVHTVGEMSASIAHEINQPLVAIENYALAARHRLVSGSPADIHKVGELLDKIASQAGRAGHVLERLRGMLKKHEPETSEIDLGQLLCEAVKLVEIGPPAARSAGRSGDRKGSPAGRRRRNPDPAGRAEPGTQWPGGDGGSSCSRSAAAWQTHA